MTSPGESGQERPATHDALALGRAVRLTRTALGLRRRELAERTGLSVPYLAQIESGDRSPSHRALLGLAAALEIPPGELLQAAGELAAGDAVAAALRTAGSPPAEVQAPPPAAPPAQAHAAGAPAAAAPGPPSAAGAVAALAAAAADLPAEDVDYLLDLARRLRRGTRDPGR